MLFHSLITSPWQGQEASDAVQMISPAAWFEQSEAWSCLCVCGIADLSMHSNGMQAGKLEVVSSVEVPRAARKIRATFCPKVHITEPEYIVMGGEDTSVYIYDVSKPSHGPIVVNQLQVRA